jgi:hypothetical protein
VIAAVVPLIVHVTGTPARVIPDASLTVAESAAVVAVGPAVPAAISVYVATASVTPSDVV